MLFARAQILRRNLQNAIRINQEFYFDARQSRGGRRHLQRKPRQRAAILGQFALALQHVNVDSRLIVHARGVEFLRARRNRRIARNDFCHRAAVGFNSQRKGRHIEQQHVFHAAVKDVRLHRCAQRHHFIGIQFRVRFAIGILLHRAANQRCTRSSSNENHFIHIARLELRIR